MARWSGRFTRTAGNKVAGFEDRLATLLAPSCRMSPRRKLFFSLAPWSLGRGKQAVATETHQTKETKIPDRMAGPLVRRPPRIQESSRVGILVASCLAPSIYEARGLANEAHLR